MVARASVTMFGVVLLSLTLLFSAPVLAQDAVSKTTQQAEPVDSKRNVYQFLEDKEIRFYKTLKDHGIYVLSGLSEDFLANVAGGNQRNLHPTLSVDLGAVLDLQTILGLPEASLHATFNYRVGPSVESVAGTAIPLSGNWGPTQTIRLSQFYWEQGFFKDRIDIVAGRMSPTLDFGTTPIACIFVSSTTCSQPGAWYFDNSSNVYPVSTWGGRVNFALTPKFYFRVGVYEDNPIQEKASEHGFDWGITHSTGALIPAEIGYASDFTNAAHPGGFTLGGYFDAASYTASDGQQMRNRTAVYATARQSVWRPDLTTKQSLILLGGAFIPQGGGPYNGQYYGGLISVAPFGPVRPSDTLAFIASYFRTNVAYSPNGSSEWVFELNYGFRVKPGITITPVTQYVIHPDEIGLGNSRKPARALIVGAQLEIDFGLVLHRPKYEVPTGRSRSPRGN